MGVEGYIHQIEDPGNDFDIYNGPDAKIQWVDAPDNVTEHWILYLEERLHMVKSESS